jgi:transketolase C-terminal domain/subunit
MIGIGDCYASHGPYEELLALYGLQAQQIAARVAEFVSQ